MSQNLGLTSCESDTTAGVVRPDITNLKINTIQQIIGHYKEVRHPGSLYKISEKYNF